jgi:hypothetical protein
MCSIIASSLRTALQNAFIQSLLGADLHAVSSAVNLASYLIDDALGIRVAIYGRPPHSLVPLVAPVFVLEWLAHFLQLGLMLVFC